MARFLTSLKTERIDQKTVQLIEPLVYVSNLEGVIEVPKGFKTDFASVPRLPLIYTLMGDTAHEAATIHDYLYATKQVSRSRADAVFEEAMEVLGINWVIRKLMWSGVRIGGWSKY